jgi:signal transduction histidine kinase/DNA-binding response OmpR family regulator
MNFFSANTQTSSSETDTNFVAPSSGYKLLVIEDNPADARLLQLMLMEVNFEYSSLVHKTSLQEGINAYTNDIDAVFLDLSLPDSRGIITLKTFLNTHSNANVIVMTGLSDTETGINAVKSGAQDYLVKGDYEGDKLLRTLYYSIERKNTMNRLQEAQVLAQVGSWELRVAAKEFYFSDYIYEIAEVPSKGRKLSYEKDAENYVDNFYTDIFKGIHEDVFKEYCKGNTKGVEKEMEFSIKSGKTKSLAFRCYITRFEEGKPVYYGIMQDITEKKKAEIIRQEKELAEESAKLKEEFITNVSHEMRTPMNAILGMSNILLNTNLTEEQYDCLNSVKQSSEMLLGIVNDILEISTLQNGKIRYEKNEFDFHELMINLMEVMQYKMEEKELVPEMLLDKDEISKILVGDKLRLNQILFNLVGNAIKFTDRGFVKIHVSKLSEKDDKVTLQFDIHDSGIGIPSDKLDAIFDTFTRIRTKDRLFEGTGLGLSIARKLVEQQDGHIWVDSEIGKGSIFHFTLPFSIAKNQDKIDNGKGYENFNVDPNKTFRLLLVEDNKLNQIVAKKTLEKQWPNITLKLAEDGQKAIDILENETFDVILMDIQMPVMDGYEATNHIRTKMPDRAHIPILAMTAFAHISKEDKFKEFGLDDFVLKPFNPDDLYYKIAIHTQNT